MNIFLVSMLEVVVIRITSHTTLFVYSLQTLYNPLYQVYQKQNHPPENPQGSKNFLQVIS